MPSRKSQIRLPKTLAHEVDKTCNAIVRPVQETVLAFRVVGRADADNISLLDNQFSALVRLAEKFPDIAGEIDWSYSVDPDESTFRVIQYLLDRRRQGKIGDLPVVNLAVAWTRP